VQTQRLNIQSQWQTYSGFRQVNPETKHRGSANLASPNTMARPVHSPPLGTVPAERFVFMKLNKPHFALDRYDARQGAACEHRMVPAEKAPPALSPGSSAEGRSARSSAELGIWRRALFAQWIEALFFLRAVGLPGRRRDFAEVPEIRRRRAAKRTMGTTLPQ